MSQFDTFIMEHRMRGWCDLFVVPFVCLSFSALAQSEPAATSLPTSLPVSVPASTSTSAPTSAPVSEPATPEEKPKPKKEKWYDKISIRGYAQLRFNEILTEEGNAQLVGDASVAEDQTFFLRRARLVVSGDVSEHVSIYVQPDLAVAQGDNLFFAQLRDFYADLHIDKERVYRFRVGQSKLPFGWENMQSSSNRLPLDRNDALNNGFKNERDLGVMFYWTPKPFQDALKRINEEGLKGSGNYGAGGIAVYAGQGGSLKEQNDGVHVMGRLSWIFEAKNGQLIEVGGQAQTGKYVVLSSAISPLGVGADARPAGTLENGGEEGLTDSRAALSFMYYAQPFGVQAEWVAGVGPALNAAQDEVVVAPLQGGYVMAMYRIQTEKGQEFWPFARYNYYEGGYKNERNAPTVHIEEIEVGFEWQFTKQIELVSMIQLTDRTNTRAISEDDTLSYEQFQGSLLRFQLQVTY
jgi:hypothetical protein